MKITIVSPTIRKEGLDIIRRSLAKQTEKKWEWLIGSPFDPEIPEAKWVKDDFAGGFWSLNRIYNKLFQQALGEIVVSWQDWVWAPPDALQKFIDAIEETNGGIISGVGDQYEKLNKYGKPEVKIWSDPRKNINHGSFYPCYWNDIEFNFCALPREIVFKVGGFDEEMDFNCRGVDAIQFMERVAVLGIETFLDQSNESFTLRHGRESYGGEEEWQKSHGLFNGEADKRKRALINSGQWPILSYLSGK